MGSASETMRKFPIVEMAMIDTGSGYPGKGIGKGRTCLGSGLIDQSQKMTAAAIQMAEKNVWAHRS